VTTNAVKSGETYYKIYEMYKLLVNKLFSHGTRMKMET